MNLKISTDSQHTIDTIKYYWLKEWNQSVVIATSFVFKYNLENTSNSDDSEVMSKALANSQLTIHNSQLIDIHHGHCNAVSYCLFCR
jgi:3-phosphoshikimate 1-carboxyvinyltransferase